MQKKHHVFNFIHHRHVNFDFFERVSKKCFENSDILLEAAITD